MLKFKRNKLVSVEKRDAGTLLVHGLLDDHIYSLWVDVSMGMEDLEILSIKGGWNRWTTPECPRSVGFLKEAVGFRLGEKDFSQKIHKIVGRKACRHYANLLLECCHTAREAAMVVKWEDARTENKDLSFEDFLGEGLRDNTETTTGSHVSVEESPSERDMTVDHGAKKKLAEGMVIDLHAHTSPVSPCSSAPVDRIIEEAKRIGLDGVCLTDHNHVWDAGQVEDLRQRHGFLVLRGNEITTDQGDMVVFGLDKEIKGIIKLEELSKEVITAGGFMIVAHPFRGFLTFGVGQLGLTPEKAMERPLFKQVDAVEVLNSKVTENENNFASQVAAGLGMPVTGGSDAHEVNEVGIYATRFTDMINDEKSLIEALKKGDYSPVAFRRAIGEEEV